MIQGMSISNKDKKLEGFPYSISVPVPISVPNKTIEGFDSVNITTDEGNLFLALQNFNSDYIDYVRCANNGDTSCVLASTGQTVNTSTLGTELASTRANSRMYPAITAMYNDVTIGGSGMNQASYLRTYGNIVAINKSNLETRNELDVKLRELNQTQDSITNSYKQQYDSTIYAGILLSAVAASLLFLVFKEL